MQLFCLFFIGMSFFTDTAFVKTDECTLIETIINDNLKKSKDSSCISMYSHHIIFRQTERKYILKELRPVLSRKEYKELNTLLNKALDTTRGVWDKDCFPINFLLQPESVVRNSILRNQKLISQNKKDLIQDVYFFSSPEFFCNNKYVLIQITNSITYNYSYGCNYLYKKDKLGFWKFVVKFNCYEM